MSVEVVPAGVHTNVLLALLDDKAVAVGFGTLADRWSIVDGGERRRLVDSEAEARMVLLGLAEDYASTGRRVSAIDELVQGLQVTHHELTNAASAASAAGGKADSAMAAAEALGVANEIGGLAAVKAIIASLAQQIHDATDTAYQAISKARAVADGT